jgi:hypothetical protein
MITINVTNKQKVMYYHEYVPELLNVRHSDPAVWYESLCINTIYRAFRTFRKPASPN